MEIKEAIGCVLLEIGSPHFDTRNTALYLQTQNALERETYINF
jgi:hypothetical protein